MSRDFLKDENLLKMAEKEFDPAVRKTAEEQIKGYMDDSCIPFSKETLKAFMGGMLFLKGVERRLDNKPLMELLGAIKGRKLDALDVTAFTTALLMGWLVRLEKGETGGVEDKLNTINL